MRAIFLTGERVYLRGMVDEDTSSASIWYDTVFPVNSAFAEEQLKEQHKEMWDVRKRQLAIVRAEDDAVIGGAVIGFGGDRRAEIQLHMAPLLANSDDLQAEALRLLAPWLLDEHNMRRVDIGLPADQEMTIAAAQGLGMVEGVRLREFFHKPGGRLDCVIYQILNPNEVRNDA